MSTMMCLPLPISGRVDRILHISDIHIRTGDRVQSRFDEYYDVIEELLISVEKNASDSTVVVLTGDLVHSKSRLESSGITLFFTLVRGLAKICPVYIIAGNHDLQQHQPDTPDLISALIHDALENVCYLRESGHYTAGNVGFGLVAIRDLLKMGDTSGQVADLPTFPDAGEFPKNVQSKVALFHGTISGCRLQNYTKSPTGYPIDWFQGYDIGLFGDVHAREVYEYAKKGWQFHWGYAGSLVQQDFGEDVLEHGYLMWDLDASTSRCCEMNIKNTYGMLKVRERQGVWYGLSQNTWVDLKMFLTNSRCPTNLAIRVTNVELATKTCLLELHRIMSETKIKYRIAPNISQGCHRGVGGPRSEFDLKNGGGDSMHIDTSSYNTSENWVRYIDKNADHNILDAHPDWKRWFMAPETLCISLNTLDAESMKHNIAERNIKLMKQVDAFNTARTIENTIRCNISLTYMSWSWILCFGQECWFDFTNLKGHMASINAPNGHGKSSFLEVICLALYGESIPSRHSKQYSSSVVCQQRPAKTKGRTVIQFQKDDHTYRVSRTYDAVSKSPSKLTITEVYLKRVAEDGSVVIVHSGKTAVDAWISRYLGSLDSFLLSSMVTQSGDQDFFQLKSQDQLELLDRSLHMHSINELSEIFRMAALAYRFVSDNVSSICDTLVAKAAELRSGQDKDNESVHSIYKDVKEEIRLIEHEIESIPETWHDICQADLEVDVEVLSGTLHKLQCQLDGYILMSKSLDMKMASKEELYQTLGTLHEKLKQKRPVHGCVQDIRTLKEKMDIAIDERDAIVARKPVEPALNIQTNGSDDIDHLNNPSIWDDRMIHIYGSLEILFDQARELGNVASMKPSISMDTLDLYEKNLEEDLACLSKHGEWAEDIYNNASFGEAFMQVESEWKELSSKKECLNNCMRIAEVNMEVGKKLWKDAEYALKHHTAHMKTLGSPPPYSTDTCNEWLERFRKLEALSTEMEARLKLVCLIKKVKEEIKGIQEANHPYNDGCWACQKQHWRVLYDEKIALLKRYEAELAHVGTELKDMGTTELEIAWQDFQKMEREAHDWNFWKMSWNIYDPALQVQRTLEDNVSCARCDWEAFEVKRNSVSDEMHKFSDAFDKLDTKYREMRYIRDNLPRWKEIKKLIEEQRVLWSAYDVQNKIVEDAKKTRESQEWREWSVWVKDMKEKEEVVAVIETAVEEVQINNIIWKVHDVERSLDILDKKHDVMTKIAYWKRIADIKPMFQHKKELKMALIELRRREQEVSHEFYKEVARREKLFEMNQECCKYAEIIQNVVSTRLALDHVMQVFAGFRKWLYEKHIIPRLLHEANTIVSSLTRSDTLKLDIDIGQVSDSQKLSFAWFMIDGPNRPPIEKASGFQRFILGLAVRITLSCIGASSVACDQLFIDEGFAACDKTHLERVPEFIENLLHLYSSIIMVSHLDEVRDSASVHVNIQREGGISKIRYGKRLFEVEESKKKFGRNMRNKDIIIL